MKITVDGNGDPPKSHLTGIFVLSASLLRSRKKDMPVEELIYDSEGGTAFLIMVNADEFDQYKSDASSIAVADVVNSFSVFRFDQGHEGKQSTPSNRELKDTFGSTNDMAIAEIMLKKGQLRASYKKKTRKVAEPEGDPRGHMM